MRTSSYNRAAKSAPRPRSPADATLMLAAPEAALEEAEAVLAVLEAPEADEPALLVADEPSVANPTELPVVRLTVVGIAPLII